MNYKKISLCPELSSEKMNYNEAKAYCKREGGMLATWSSDMVGQKLCDDTFELWTVIPINCTCTCTVQKAEGTHTNLYRSFAWYWWFLIKLRLNFTELAISSNFHLFITIIV